MNIHNQWILGQSCLLFYKYFCKSPALKWSFGLERLFTNLLTAGRNRASMAIQNVWILGLERAPDFSSRGSRIHGTPSFSLKTPEDLECLRPFDARMVFYAAFSWPALSPLCAALFERPMLSRPIRTLAAPLPILRGKIGSCLSMLLHNSSFFRVQGIPSPHQPIRAFDRRGR